MKFEAALAELEQIVQGMEGGRLPLEESLAAYRRGSELLKHCQQQLSDAERKIQILEDGVLREFDAATGRAP
jgi:exodeoxyribonuclease VII small subunit